MPLLLVEQLVVVLLYSPCHDSHVIIAVEWKTTWKTTSTREGGLRLSVVVSAVNRRRLEFIGVRRWRSTGGGSDCTSVRSSTDDACRMLHVIKVELQGKLKAEQG